MTMISWCVAGRQTAAMVGVVLALWLAGCSKPEPPDKERPPEPQAAQSTQSTQLRDAIQAPIDKARDVEADMQKAADDQRAAIAEQTD